MYNMSYNLIFHSLLRDVFWNGMQISTVSTVEFKASKLQIIENDTLLDE